MQREELEQELISRYQSGASCPEIAASIHRSVSFVWKIVRAAGAGRSHAEAMALRMVKFPNLSEHRGLQCVFHSAKNRAWIPAGSRYEFMRMAQLEDDPNVRSFERARDRIGYRHDGSVSYYIPDLRVVTIDGSVRVEEIKPAAMVHGCKVQAKIHAASAYYSPLGTSFVVITEQEIGIDYIKSFRWDGFASVSHAERETLRKERERVRQRESKRRERAAMTPEERQARNDQLRAYHRAKMATITPAELAERRAKNTEAQRRRRVRRDVA